MADRRVAGYALAAGVFALDRLTKWIVETRVGIFDTYRIIPGFFDIVHSQNKGVAFGIFNDAGPEWRTTLLVALSLAAVAVLALMVWKTHRDRLTMYGLSLALGGAAGNVYDRAMWGRVTDFLEFYIGRWHWPTFNAADTAISIGAGLVLLDALLSKR